MVRQREETKKQLNAKFADINRNKDFTSAEMKRVKDTLRAFESKFTHQLRNMRKEYEEKIEEFRSFNKAKLTETKDRLDKIEDSIHQEREDRIRETHQENRNVLTLQTNLWKM